MGMTISVPEPEPKKRREFALPPFFLRMETKERGQVQYGMLFFQAKQLMFRSGGIIVFENIP